MYIYPHTTTPRLARVAAEREESAGVCARPRTINSSGCYHCTTALGRCAQVRGSVKPTLGSSLSLRAWRSIARSSSRCSQSTASAGASCSQGRWFAASASRLLGTIKALSRLYQQWCAASASPEHLPSNTIHLMRNGGSSGHTKRIQTLSPLYLYPYPSTHHTHATLPALHATARRPFPLHPHHEYNEDA